MGTWGTGLYQSDEAKDLKEDLGEWLGVPKTPEELVAALIAEKRPVDPPEHPDDCTFWLVLADQFHHFDIDVPDVRAKALQIIGDGTDIRLQTELDLGEADQAKRVKVLQDLKEKWSTPHLKPRKRKILKPEPQLLKTGEVYTYPTMDGNPRHEPLGTVEKERYRFEPDATNVFVVLNETRVFHDLFARAFIAPLAMFHEHAPPTLRDCMECCFMTEASYLYETFEPVGGWVGVCKKDLKFIEAQKIGTLDFNPDRLRDVFGDALRPPIYRFEKGSLFFLNANLGHQSSIARGWPWGGLDHGLGTMIRNAK